MLKSIKNINSRTLVRFCLFLGFFGHSLVSFKLSPSYGLHYKLIDSVNFTTFENSTILFVHAFFDLIIAFLILILDNKKIIKLILTYLMIVCVVALIFYWQQTSHIFGIAECMRRFPWICFALFLLNNKYTYIRIGVSFAFLSHGLASLEILGMNQGHIEIANQFFSIDNAKEFVRITGYSDLIIGLFLLQSLFTRYIIVVATLWLSLIVFASFYVGFPDAIFRSGFLIATIFVLKDNRTHKPLFTI